MDVIALRSMSLGASKITATTAVPTPSNTAPDTSAVGVLALTDALDLSISSGDGVPPSVCFLAGMAGGSATYALRVYGLFKSGTSWVPMLLYYATSVVADQTPGGDANANSFASGDKVAGAITVNAITNSGIHQTTSYAAGPSHVYLDTRGCPYLVFVTDNAAAFFLVRKAS